MVAQCVGKIYHVVIYNPNERNISAQEMHFLLTDINECDSIPCLNRATCVGNETTYNCACAAGYKGFNCETGRCEYYLTYSAD